MRERTMELTVDAIRADRYRLKVQDEEYDGITWEVSDERRRDVVHRIEDWIGWF